MTRISCGAFAKRHLVASLLQMRGVEVEQSWMIQDNPVWGGTARMRRFRVPEGTVEAFADSVRRELSGRPIGEIVSIRAQGSRLVLRFRKLGTTELVYDTRPEGDGFVATLVSERVAPFHAPFRAEFERRLEQILDGLGATLEG